MNASIAGAVVAVFWICGVGGGLVYFVLTRTKLLESVPMRAGLTADVIRKYFRLVVLVMAIPAAVIGWLAGPIVGEAFQ